MAYVITVMVISKKTKKGLSGHKVKRYGGSEVKTDSKGMATIIAENSSVTIYVDGVQAYNGYASSAPQPIIFEKS